MAKFTEEFKQEMVEACASGTSPKKLAKQYDVSDVSIRNWIKKSGVEVRRYRPQYSLEFKQKIVDLYLAGSSTYKLQQEYKVDGKAVARWVKAFGHKLVPRSRPRSVEFKRKIVDIYLSGASSYQILRDYGISPENTCRWIKELGEEPRISSTILSEDGTQKTCFTCEKMQPLDNFSAYADGVGGKSPWCKNCLQTSRRLTTYKISPKDFDAMIQKQEGRCAICKEVPSEGAGFGKGWHVDHDHACCPAKGKTCGKCIRGLLCSTCNSGLGLFKDSEEVLQNAISYLAKNRKENSVIQGTRQAAS